jgi:predicted permease
MFEILRDARLAVRMAARKPWTTLVAVLSLAVAIGPNSATFSVLDRLILQPSSVKSGQAFQLYTRNDRTGQAGALSYGDLLDYSAAARDVADVIGVSGGGGRLVSPSGREMVVIHAVTENYFSALGAQPAAGRLLAARDATFAAVWPVVIADSLASRQFGGAANAIGKNLIVSKNRFLVVGVVRRGVQCPGMEVFPPDVWMPLGGLASLLPFKARELPLREAMVVVRKGVPVAKVQAVLSAVAQRLASERPGTDRGTRVVLRSPSDTPLANIVLGLVGLVLLIACANVAGILLAYGEERRREFSVRLALGAPRGRLIRLLIIESLFLALTAAALGLPIAAGTLQALKASSSIPFVPVRTFLPDVELSYRAAGYTIFLSVVAALAAGLTPALRFSRPDLIQELRSGTNATARRRGFRMVLVVGQVAVSQFLLVSGALLVGSYLDVQRVRPGFDVNRSVVVALVSGVGEDIDYARLEQRLGATPGVRRVSYVTDMPLQTGFGGADVFVPGRDAAIEVEMTKAGPRYFAIMGTRLLRGRDFEANDPGAVVVNETMARRFWGSAGAAMGKALRVGKTESHVVGVAEDGKYHTLQEAPQPFLFVGAPLGPRNEAALLIETVPGSAPAMLDRVRRIIRDTEPRGAILGLDTLPHLLAFALFPFRMAAALVSLLAILGVSLAGVGLYGIISCSVAQRTREIGLRAVLGGTPADILSAVILDVMWKAVVGSLIGLALALIALAAIGWDVPGVHTTVPVGIAGGVLAFLVVAALAAFAPARRALRVEPMVALREE